MPVSPGGGSPVRFGLYQAGMRTSEEAAGKRLERAMWRAHRERQRGSAGASQATDPVEGSSNMGRSGCMPVEMDSRPRVWRTSRSTASSGDRTGTEAEREVG